MLGAPGLSDSLTMGVNYRLSKYRDEHGQRPFTLTVVFVIGAVLLLIAAGFAADTIGRHIGEASTVRTGTEFAESQAELVGDALARAFASPVHVEDGTARLPDAESGGEAGALALLLRLAGSDDLNSLFANINVHHLAVMTPEGVTIWEFGADAGFDAASEIQEHGGPGVTVSKLYRDIEIEHADGHNHTADLIESFLPIRADTGEILFLFHMTRDITETLEANVAATQREFRNATLITFGSLLFALAILVFGLDLKISSRNRQVVSRERVLREEADDRNTELQRLDNAKNEFLSSLSHELKTPLAAILGFARILRKNKHQNLSEQQVSQLEIINRNGERLDLLINDLLDLSRVQDGRIVLEEQETEVTSLLRAAVDAMLPITDERRQICRLKLDHSEAWVDLDANRVSQVITNLVTNASKYSPHDSTISVSSRLEVTDWVFSVADEGMGISAEDQENLFTMFYRTPGAQKSGIPGTGIGLYLANEIVRMHGGTISLESAPGMGTTVTIRLHGVRRSARTVKTDAASFSNTFGDLGEVV